MEPTAVVRDAPHEWSKGKTWQASEPQLSGKRPWPARLEPIGRKLGREPHLTNSFYIAHF